MKQQIKSIIQQHPRTYSKLIKKDPALLEWVNTNSTTASQHLPSQIYSAVSGESDMCEHGNQKKFVRISQGFAGCGPANQCKCTRDAISSSVKQTKSQYSLQQTDNINQKRQQTMLGKYGVAYNSQREDVKHIWKKPKIPLEVYNKLIDHRWLANEYVTKGKTAVDIAQHLGVYYSTVIDYCRHHGFKIRQHSQYSQVEVEIAAFITELGFIVETNDRQTLDNKEIDVLVPSANLGIEVNGLYWHSYAHSTVDNENKHRHLDKTLLAQKKNVELLHITDWEWKNKPDIVKSIIASKLGLTSRIYARKTQCRQIDSSIGRQFLDQHHIQGKCASSAYFGLYYDDNLVMVGSAGKSRFNSAAVELHRLATVQRHTVVGGASKLVKRLIQHFETDSMTSYCDRDKSTGNMYRSLGFELVKETGPGYFWTDGNNIYSRYKCQKKNLATWLDSFDAAKSESENMFAAGYRRFWTCGNLVFKKNISSTSARG